SNNTFIGANALPGTAQQLNYATAIGSDVIVTTSGTIVLGRTDDVTVLGAAGDDRSGNRLQVTGGIKSTGMLSANALALISGNRNGVWINNDATAGATAGASNALVQTGDSTLLFSHGAIDGATGLVIGPWSSNGTGLRVSNGGVAVGGALAVNGPVSGSSAYAVLSDARLKTNVEKISGALAVINQLQGVRYDFNRAAFPDRNFESQRQLGFIAQQIEPFVPEVVRTGADGYKSVQYAPMLALLVEGVKEQQQILKHLVKKDPATLLVDIKTFQANDAVFENIKTTNIKTASLEAETARIKKLEADRIESKFVRSDVVKSGEIEVFVSVGSFQPIFAPQADSQYIVNATAEDGSSAFASVAFMGGKISITPISGKGVDVTAIGAQVGLVAASKKVKATWIRMS
ncbi:MAG: tail fiber domain-containing protein, partial [Herminiimonas sp.]|nr:tail fiber domain-containing protein [Herminiimonas sp.]